MTLPKALSKSSALSDAPISCAIATKRLCRSASVSLGRLRLGFCGISSAHIFCNRSRIFGDHLIGPSAVIIAGQKQRTSTIGANKHGENQYRQPKHHERRNHQCRKCRQDEPLSQAKIRQLLSNTDPFLEWRGAFQKFFAAFQKDQSSRLDLLRWRQDWGRPEIEEIADHETAVA